MEGFCGGGRRLSPQNPSCLPTRRCAARDIIRQLGDAPTFRDEGEIAGKCVIYLQTNYNAATPFLWYAISELVFHQTAKGKLLWVVCNGTGKS